MTAALAFTYEPAPAYAWADTGPRFPLSTEAPADDVRRPVLSTDPLLVDLCAGRRRVSSLRDTEAAEDLGLDGLACLTARGWEPTKAGRELVGPVLQRWPRYALPTRGRHAVRRLR